ANVTTRRSRARPHGRSVPPHQQTTSPDLSRASTDSSEPRTVITVVPPAPLGRPSRHQAKDLRRAVAFADMPTVAPSTSPRWSHSATSATTTPSVTGTRCYVDVLRGGGHPRASDPALKQPGTGTQAR